MTPINILGPPRTGRKVLTEKQCLEEVRSQIEQENHGLQGLIAKPENLSNATPLPAAQIDPSVHPYFIRPGRFGFESMRGIGGGFVIEGLKLPMGSFDEFHVESGVRHPGNRNFSKWYSETKRSQPGHGVMPIDVLYGLAVICFEAPAAYLPVAQQIKNQVLDVMTGGLSAYTSTMILYDRGFEGVARLNVGSGWKSNHPFATVYHTHMFLREDKDLRTAIATSDKVVAHRILNLFGENDLERCINVLEWVTGGRSPLIVPHPFLGVKESDSVCSPMIGLSQEGFAGIYLRQSLKEDRGAILVYAPAKHYQKI